MNNIFERYQFLECFDKEVITFLDTEHNIEIYEYSLTTIDNLVLNVCINLLEQRCSITLQNNLTRYAILDLNVHRIVHISITQEAQITILKIFKRNNASGPFNDHTTQPTCLHMVIKPQISFRLDL